MSSWGVSVYGDPCRECGFSWSTTDDDARSLVMATPTRFASLIGQRDGSQRYGAHAWPVVGYVCHVGDNLRIWAERLIGVARGATPEIAAYDSDQLAEARRYQQVPLPGALWSLERSVQSWLFAVGVAAEGGVVVVHPDRGPQSVTDVVRSNAHDAYHHGWDIERAVRACGT
jgi:hypothetical protein